MISFGYTVRVEGSFHSKCPTVFSKLFVENEVDRRFGGSQKGLANVAETAIAAYVLDIDLKLLINYILRFEQEH